MLDDDSLPYLPDGVNPDSARNPMPSIIRGMQQLIGRLCPGDNTVVPFDISFGFTWFYEMLASEALEIQVVDDFEVPMALGTYAEGKTAALAMRDREMELLLGDLQTDGTANGPEMGLVLYVDRGFLLLLEEHYATDLHRAEVFCATLEELYEDSQFPFVMMGVGLS